MFENWSSEDWWYALGVVLVLAVVAAGVYKAWPCGSGQMATPWNVWSQRCMPKGVVTCIPACGAGKTCVNGACQ